MFKPIGWIRETSPYPDVIGQCMICTSHKASNRGYPRINRNGEIISIARAVLHRRYGRQPAGVVCRHTCDNQLCINPDHLIPGSPGDNLRDIVKHDRNHIGKRSAKLKKSDVIEIRKMLDLKIHQAVIGKKFGVIGPTISAIKNRRSWGWLHGKS